MVFTQPPVEAALRQRASEHPTVEVGLGTELVELVQTTDQVTLQLRSDAGERRSVSARYVVGCDGAASTVRGLVGIEYEDLEFDEPWLVVDMLVNERGLAKLPQVSVQYCDPARPSTYLIGPGGHRRWEERRSCPARTVARWKTRRMSGGSSALDHPRGREPFGAGALSLPCACRARAAVWPGFHRRRRRAPAAAVHRPRHVPGRPRRRQPELEAAPRARRKGDGRAARHLRARAPPAREAADTLVKAIGQLVCERDPAAAQARDDPLLAETGGTVSTVPAPGADSANRAGLSFCDSSSGQRHDLPAAPVTDTQGEDLVLLDAVAGTSFRVVVNDKLPLTAARR